MSAGRAGVAPRSSGAIASSLLGALLALAIATALTVWAHTLVALGMYPESVSSTETAAPLLGLAVGCMWAGRRTQLRPGIVGLGVAAVLVLLWFAQWLFLAGRADPQLWWRQALPGVTVHHLLWWAAALGVGVAAGIVGGRLRERTRWVWVAVACTILAVIAAAMQITAMRQRAAELPFGQERALAPGVSITCRAPQGDGTMVRLLSFDFAQNPGLRLRLYDADSDDARPWDDLNTSWLAESLDFVVAKLRARAHSRGREVLAVCNAGFFNMGLGRCFLGSHVAPIVVGGTPLYNVMPAEPGKWAFGISEDAGRPRFHLVEAMPWDRLGDEFETAVGHVRPLRAAGRSLPLGPGAGVTRLKCSRTSLGWTPDSGRLFLLTVRDPDGEIPGIRQMQSGRRQTGGWDLADLQRFWERMGVDDAIVLDGGDSTKLAYRRSENCYVPVTSGYCLSRTLGYWRDRPLRFFVPVLPAAQSHAGVMNYLYVEAPKRQLD